MQFILKRILPVLMISLLFNACKKEQEITPTSDEVETLFTLLNSQETGIDFFNEVKNQKNFNIFKYRNFYNGEGLP